MYDQHVVLGFHTPPRYGDTPELRSAFDPGCARQDFNQDLYNTIAEDLEIQTELLRGRAGESFMEKSASVPRKR